MTTIASASDSLRIDGHPTLEKFAVTRLFFASVATLFFELLVIRYLSTEIRVFAYLKNLPLIASFLGIGLGMTLGRRQRLERIFPLVVLTTFALIRWSSYLGLTHVGFPDASYILFGDQGFEGLPPLLLLVRYLVVVTTVLALLVLVFVVLGGLVGEYLRGQEPLFGYGVNLAGSLTGILLFTLLAFLQTPPIAWLLVGLSIIAPFWRRQPLTLALFALTAIIHVAPGASTFWSPYYRIDIERLPSPPGYANASAYNLNVNHDYHQRMVDLSPRFLQKFPTAEPNKSSQLTYQLPYLLVPHPETVLIVGAGTGNDVAAALRNGVRHVDAVEIDPLILELGRRYHPEHPYDSPLVTAYVDDARAFFSKAPQKYNLIVFAYLDSHTLFSSMSSLRLDNYVYTLQSIEAARRLLKPDGTLVLAFSGGVPFINERFYSMLTRAFGTAPLAYKTGYDTTGIVYVAGGALARTSTVAFPDISSQLGKADTVVPTDSWPFLYLRGRAIPASMMVILIAFLIGARRLLKRTTGTEWSTNYGYLQMFFLGAGFMLLETKGTTELSLLFGSTWVVNSIVIGAFLLMGYLANLMVQARSLTVGLSYSLLFPSLALTLLLPASRFTGASIAARVLASILLVALPAFFSGIVFSRSFKRSQQPERALGVNLFGAMAGGMLENLVMIGGTPSLGVLAFLLYGSAAYFLLRQRGTPLDFSAEVEVVETSMMKA